MDDAPKKKTNEEKRYLHKKNIEKKIKNTFLNFFNF